MSAAEFGLDDVAPQFRKHVAPDAPEKLKRMAAKGVIPMPPAEQIKVLYLLSRDPAEEIAATAKETTGELPDRLLSATLRGDLPPAILDFLAESLAGKPQYEELVLLNANTSDATFVRLAAQVDEKLLEIVADNQLRLLREPAPADLHLRLARAYLSVHYRAQAVQALRAGAQVEPDHPGIHDTFVTLGIRRRPVLPFLRRGNPVNKYLGLLRHRLFPQTTEVK